MLADGGRANHLAKQSDSPAAATPESNRKNGYIPQVPSPWRFATVTSVERSLPSTTATGVALSSCRITQPAIRRRETLHPGKRSTHPALTEGRDLRKMGSSEILMGRGAHASSVKASEHGGITASTLAGDELSRVETCAPYLSNLFPQPPQKNPLFSGFCNRPSARILFDVFL